MAQWVLPCLLIGLSACNRQERELDCADPLEVPSGIPAFTLNSFDSDQSVMAGRHVLMNQNNGRNSWATVVDACGNPVWWEANEDPANRIFRAKMAANGKSVLIGEKDIDDLADTATIRRVSTRNKLLSRTRALEAHHDFEEMDDGTFSWISHQYARNVWFPGMNADLVSDVVRSTQEGNDEPVDEQIFSLFQDSGVEPFWVCDHMWPSDRVPGFGEWSHSNSLMWEPEGDAYYLLARYWDAIVKFERDGTLAWHMGGPLNEFELIGDTVLPRHAHMSEYWRDGMLVFDNRNHSGLPSRVVEYAIDEQARTVEEVWSVEQPDGKLVGFLGDAVRLPGGNVLVTWSTEGRLTEYNADGEIVWELQSDSNLTRTEWVPNWPEPR